MAQYGTKHGHATGVLEVMLANPDVEVVGVYEPDPERRRTLETAGKPPWSDVSWFDSPAEFLDDPSVLAVASEGSNAESLDHTEAIVDAGKHVFYDKPAGTDYRRFERIVGKARSAGPPGADGLHVSPSRRIQPHRRVGRSGLLGDVFSVRAHMSTHLDRPAQEAIARHPGGIFYDLSGHMIDQIVWILGRPTKVTSFLRQDATDVAGIQRQHPLRARVRLGDGVRRHRGRGDSPDGASIRGVRHGRIGDHGAVRTAGTDPAVPQRGARRIPCRGIDGRGRGPAAVRRQPGVIRKGPTRREGPRPVPGPRTASPGNDPALDRPRSGE